MISFNYTPIFFMSMLAVMPTMELQLQDLLDDKYLAFDGM